MPVRDIGAPYFARFSGVSGTGPLVTVVLVTVAPDDIAVALEFEADVSALGAVGAIVGSAAGDEGAGAAAGSLGIAPDIDWAAAAPAREAAKKPAAAAIWRAFTACSLIRPSALTTGSLRPTSRAVAGITRS